jgi:hypothetical protein
MHGNIEQLATPDDCRGEIARILAGAVLRLRARAALSAPAQLPVPRILADSGANCLEVHDPTRLSVHPG